MSVLTNEMRLQQLATSRETALVKGDEKIAVFGAGGQIGTKLKAVLDKIYPGKVIYCDNQDSVDRYAKNPQSPYADGELKALDVTDMKATEDFVRGHNVRVIINLAALLSAVAEQKPDLAHKINFDVPRSLMKLMNDMQEAKNRWEKGGKVGEEPHTIRKLQIMSSMASQEFGAEPGDSAEVISAKASLQQYSSTKAVFPAQSNYGMQKGSIEQDAKYYSSKRGLDINIPCLAGVLNAHTPWPSNGTTEELDKLVVAAAIHKVYGADWEKKLREFIIARDGKEGEEALAKGHYINNGKYVPEVTGDTKFAMIDGNTLAETVLLLLHKDLRKIGPVQNVYEYTARMMDAASVLKKPELNPDFPVDFATKQRHLPIAGKIEPDHLMECVDEGKMKRAAIWAHGMDTSITESEEVIGKFKQYTAEQSIIDQYKRAVAIFQKMKLSESSVNVSPKSVGTERAVG